MTANPYALALAVVVGGSGFGARSAHAQSPAVPPSAPAAGLVLGPAPATATATDRGPAPAPATDQGPDLGSDRGPDLGPEVALDRALDQALGAAADAANVWHWSWVGVFAATVVGQGVLVGVVDEERARYAQLVGGGAPVTGLTLQLVQPLAALSYAADRLSWQGLDAAGQVRAKRALLQRYAESEAEQRNWFAHAGPIFLHLTLGGVVWLVFDQPVQAAIQTGAGLAVSQLHTWTSPQVATDALAGLQTAPRLQVAPVISVGYLGLAGRF